jgi:CRISPR-associated protein Cas2
MEDRLLVVYDITGDPAGRRLRLVCRVLEGFGVRVQYSVFECAVNEAAKAIMLAELRRAIDKRCDSVRVYRIGSAHALELGRQPRYHDADDLVI